MSPRRQRFLTLLIVLYITFIGGTAYAHTGATPDFVRLGFIAGPLVAWLADLIKNHRAIPHTPLDLPLAAAAIWLLIAAGFAVDRRISLEFTWPFLAQILGFYLVVDLMRRGWTPHFKFALLVVALVIVVVSGIELGIWYAGWFKIGGTADPIPPIPTRLNVALNVTTIQGNYLAMLIPLVAAGALSRRERRARVALAGLALILIGIEILTFSRGGLLGAVVGLSLLAAFGLLRWGRRTGRAPSLLRAQILLALAVVAVIGVGLLIAVWSASSSREDSDRGRFDTWHSALEMENDHLVTGVGPGMFGLALRSYRDPAYAQDKLVSAHNVFLNILAETGLVGLIILLWLIVVFGHTWQSAWARWGLEEALIARRIWLEGALAAFVAYGVHSMVDTFPLTSSVLPLIILAAYTVTEPKPDNTPASLWRVRLSWAILGVIAAYSTGIVRLDVAQGWMTLGRQAMDRGDLTTALDRAKRARAWDPSLSLYDLHYAYVLGLLADQNPGEFLDRAIDAHIIALNEEPTWDLGWANLAGLYDQTPTKAREALQRAAAINPTNAAYWFRLGEVQRALLENPDLAEYALRTNPSGVEQYLNDGEIPLARRFYVAALLPPLEDVPIDAGVKQDLQATIAQLAAQAETDSNWLSHLALGMYTHRITKHDDQALQWLDQAVRERPVDERPLLERAEIYLARGDLGAAERDARTALFVDPHGGALGNYILAQIEEQRGASDHEVERLLKASVRPRPVMQYFAGTVYARPASFRLLPQLRAPGMASHTYAGWLALAQRYADQGKTDEAQRVYEDLLEQNPYLDQAKQALAGLTGNQK